jgi:hypothetical protein
MSRAGPVDWLVAVSAVLLAGCGSSSQQRPSRSAPPPAKPATGLPAGSRVLLKGVSPLSWGDAAAGSLYLTRDVTPAADAHAEVIDELMRLDPRSGHVLAVRGLDSEFGRAILAAGSLWITTTSRQQGTLLWRLDPCSLTLRSRIPLPSDRQATGLTGSLAVADGQLWVGSRTLNRVSLASGSVDRVVKLPYPGPVQVAADPSGRVLLAVLGYVHPTYLARLNARTGAVEARVTVPWSVNQPSTTGVIDGGAWIYNSVGMARASWRIALGTLKATRTHALPIPDMQSFAGVINGILWVTEPLDVGTLTYCANPVTGQLRAQLPLLVGNSRFLTADRTSVLGFRAIRETDRRRGRCSSQRGSRAQPYSG